MEIYDGYEIKIDGSWILSIPDDDFNLEITETSGFPLQIETTSSCKIGEESVTKSKPENNTECIF
jgi:hypothetical protein